MVETRESSARAVRFMPMELCGRGGVEAPTNRSGGIIMGFGRGMLLWLLGIPLPIIILLALFWR